MEGIGWYTYEVVKRIVETHPEDDFILFFDRKPSSEFDFGPNAKQVILSPQALSLIHISEPTRPY